MSGSRRSVPRPEHGASTRTESNGREKGSGRSRSACTMRTLLAPGGRHRVAQQLHAPVADVAGDEQSLHSPIAAAIAVVLPPGEAQVSSTRRPGSLAGEQRDELRRFVLHDEPACSEAGAAQRVTLVHDERVRREASAAGRRRPPPAAAPPAAAASAARRFARSVSGAGLLLNRSHASAASKPRRSYQRAASQRGMRQRDAESSRAQPSRSARIGGPRAAAEAIVASARDRLAARRSRSRSRSSCRPAAPGSPHRPRPPRPGRA